MKKKKCQWLFKNKVHTDFDFFCIMVGKDSSNQVSKQPEFSWNDKRKKTF